MYKTEMSDREVIGIFVIEILPGSITSGTCHKWNGSQRWIMG